MERICSIDKYCINFKYGGNRRAFVVNNSNCDIEFRTKKLEVIAYLHNPIAPSPFMYESETESESEEEEDEDRDQVIPNIFVQISNSSHIICANIQNPILHIYNIGGEMESNSRITNRINLSEYNEIENKVLIREIIHIYGELLAIVIIPIRTPLTCCQTT